MELVFSAFSGRNNWDDISTDGLHASGIKQIWENVFKIWIKSNNKNPIGYLDEGQACLFLKKSFFFHLFIALLKGYVFSELLLQKLNDEDR